MSKTIRQPFLLFIRFFVEENLEFTNVSSNPGPRRAIIRISISLYQSECITDLTGRRRTNHDESSERNDVAREHGPVFLFSSERSISRRLQTDWQQMWPTPIISYRSRWPRDNINYSTIHVVAFDTINLSRVRLRLHTRREFGRRPWTEWPLLSPRTAAVSY